MFRQRVFCLSNSLLNDVATADLLLGPMFLEKPEVREENQFRSGRIIYFGKPHCKYSAAIIIRFVWGWGLVPVWT